MRAVVARERRDIHHDEAAVAGIVVVDGPNMKRPRAARRVEFNPVADGRAVLDREALGYDDGIGADRLPERGAPVHRVLEQQPAVRGHHVEAAGAQQDQVAIRPIRQVDGAKPINGDNRRMRRQEPLGRLRDAAGRAGANRPAVTGGHEEVRLQRLSDPVGHRVPEAADHDGDCRQHRQTDDQGRHGDGQPRGRRREIRVRQQALDPEPARQQGTPLPAE